MTAILENINPYSKFGLRRRATYDEIANLIGENEKLTGQLPDRTATMFKASPEGSFFDGMDSLEVLKEQQNRIHKRQLQELLLRQNLGSGTYHIERLRQQNQQMQPPEPETQSDTNIGEATMQSQLQERARQAVERQQRTAEAHQGVLDRASTPSVVRRIFENLSTPELRQPIPRQVTQPEGLSSGSEELLSEELMTAREKPSFEDKKQETIYFSLRVENPDADDTELDSASKVLNKYRDKTSGAIVQNIGQMTEIYDTLRDNGFIVQGSYNKMMNLIDKLNKTRGAEAKSEIRKQMRQHYTDTVYNVFIADIARRKGAMTKARARPSGM